MSGLLASLSKSRDKNLRLGTRQHYEDALLYDYEYRRRRKDVHFYRALAQRVGGPVLELGCGSGRLSIPLARAGLPVLGLDLSQAMLVRLREKLRRVPLAARERIQLARGNLHDLPIAGEFSLVVSAFNTLQHVYENRDLTSLFRRVRQVLRPGGLFAFDVLNPDLHWLTRDPQRRWARTRFTHPSSGRRLVYTTNHVYDPITQIAMIKLYYEPVDQPSGRSRTVRLAHRQYFPQELQSLVEHAGLRIVALYGDFSRGRLRADSESQVFVCA